jgi:hypothetical protein
LALVDDDDRNRRQRFETAPDDVYFEAAGDGDSSPTTIVDIGSDVQSFHSALDLANINLYSHMSCPILSSDLLTNSYATYLAHYSMQQSISGIVVGVYNYYF